MSGKDYMGSKYSEQLFGAQGGKVNEIPESQQQKQYDSQVKDLFWKQYLDEARTYDKPQTMSKSKIKQVRG
jgi:hypothetical protein